MSKEQTFSEKYPQIWGEIEREYPITPELVKEQNPDFSNMQCGFRAHQNYHSRRFAIRGAEIALENQLNRKRLTKTIASFIERNFPESLDGDHFLVSQLSDILYEQLTTPPNK